jgi:parallel beta-helix repeat protein
MTRVNGITIQNCISEWSWLDGILTDGSGDPSNSDIIIQDSIFRYNGVEGIAFTSHDGADVYRDITIRRNHIYENALYQGQWVSTHNWSGGIKFFCNDDGAEGQNIIIEENYVHDCGETVSGVGIWLDFVENTSEYPNIIRHNRIHGCRSNGIFLEASNNARVYGNIVYDCGIFGETWFARGPMRIAARPIVPETPTHNSSGNLIYNNVFIGGIHGVAVLVTQLGGTEAYVSDNEIINNIIVGASAYSMYLINGGDNDDVWGSGNVYNSNCLGAEGSEFVKIRWSGEDCETYNEWISESGQEDNNEELDPVFTDAGSDDYTLAPGSPCIDAGVNLGPPYNIVFLPGSTVPDGVITGNQDDY